MTHIIFECTATGQGLIWELLEQLWKNTGATWKAPCWGSVFGAACAVFKTSEGNRKTYIEQLWCILCTEALHLIWKLRCGRVIQNEGADFQPSEITNRFYSTLDSRIDLDRRTAMMSKGKRSLKTADVARIWIPVLENGNNLPPKWVGDRGVLVGIKRGR